MEARAAPSGLFADLVHIDRKLAKLIHAVPDQPADALIRAMTEISNDKREMVDQYFDDSTYGVKFSEVFRKLDCLDYMLGTATGRIAEDFAHFSEGKVVGLIERGKKCKQRLEGELHESSNVPPGLFNSLVHIDRKLAKLIHAVPDQPADALIRAMTEISNDKREMVDQYFDDLTYGVKFSEVFRKLDCLDYMLGTATGRIAEDFAHFSEGKVVGLIERGKKCKQRLEGELHAASQAEPLNISRISANFVEADRATYYSVPTVTHPPGTTISYRWTLDVSSPAAKVDPNFGLDTNCNNHGVLSGTDATFVWHHGNTGDPVHDDGCNHDLQGTYGHQGLITVKVSDSRGQSCTATYKWTKSSGSVADAASNASCTGSNP